METARWSETVNDYYPVFPRPRWGHGQAAHPGLKAVLDRSRASYQAVLAKISANRAALHAVPYAHDPAILGPYWNNAVFSCLDAAALVHFLLDRRPRHYLEIGSGYSTLFARHAIRWGNLNTTITSLDPQPRTQIDSLCNDVIRESLENCDLNIFETLLPGDILFFDGSHRVFTNSDVTVFFLDILPRLRPGVLVHVHDIFLPCDYPPEWNNRLYSEQYMIAAMLLCPAPRFRVVLPNYFVCTDVALGQEVKYIFRSEGGTDIPFIYKTDTPCPGVSFWFEMV